MECMGSFRQGPPGYGGHVIPSRPSSQAVKAGGKSKGRCSPETGPEGITLNQISRGLLTVSFIRFVIRSFIHLFIGCDALSQAR